MPLVDDSLADWRNPEWRERDLEGLAEFFNNYEIPFWGFGATDKNKQFYLKQMVEAKKNQHTDVLKKVKRLCKEFDFKAGLLISTLA